MIVYELHVGTFTDAGTYAAAAERLRYLVDLGVTAIELMPLSAFAGVHGWGYDGVAPFAPHASYGSREDLARFVDAAHGLGLSVLLDVVYNHLGPSGNYLAAYSPAYFAKDRRNRWGAALDFTQPAVRALVLESARMWLEDLRFDGLRLDATHAIDDPSPDHVLSELARSVKTMTPRRVLVAEDERIDPARVTRDGLDGIWADDVHHQIHATLSGEQDGYYGAYVPGAPGVARAIERGGSLPPAAFVVSLQNHDQIGNRALGERLSSLPGVSLDLFCAASVLLLALPTTPLLFMGQEWAASSPFLYFTDHDPELGALVSAGRRDEFRSFSAFADPDARARIPDPQARATFERSRLDWAERTRPPHARVLAVHRAMIHLRRSDPVLRRAERDRLRATAWGDVLVVERPSVAGKGASAATSTDDLRIVVTNFGRAPAVTRALLPPGASDVRLLLSSSEASSLELTPPETTLVLAARRAP
jgi:maltooligosyltrehalose trehalohydrolase